MSALLIDGRAIAREVHEEVRVRVAALAARGIVPGLTVVLAGDDPASAIYVRNKARLAAKLGINAHTVRLPADVSVAALHACVAGLNADPAVHGILVQLPLPAGISPADERAITHAIDPDKDVDGLHPLNLGRLVAGEPVFVACTPSGCLRMLQSSGFDPAGKRAVVIGRSTIVGKPMALLLLAANATVTLCHSRTPDLAARVREADIVVAAVGRPELVRGDWIKPGAAVIDVGINRLPDGRLVGDVAFDEVQAVAGGVSPVPGGVGPMTIACLMQNVCLAAERRAASALGKG
ncbi:MAG: bifunctional methylenetetrahydrofolate dehydrogenase/methenyltetrahydrofolate cyclohydrolase FolD [Myxococcales bacterium]|nr:bifunctional methylenetetrahydrofolate dehydrogenase/methenyltetrahydrofolate cyclohydrolase FolD [Myxococcales bacterium]